MLSYIIEPEQLLAELTADNLLIVDLGSVTEYQQGHIPGALHLDVGQLRLGRLPAPGLLPDPQSLEQTLQSLGINNVHVDGRHVIAYDHAHNINACRLLWTLEAAGHAGHSLLNGGMTAWVDAGFPIQTIANTAATIGSIAVKINATVCADREYVLQSLNNPQIKILDARSPEEYHGLKSASLRKGHIPNAINLNWLDTIDVNSLRFKPAEELRALLAERGVDKEDEIIVYCQTHQRSAHSFVMLKSLGFEQVRGYAGSWSEWGNDPQLPIVLFYSNPMR